MISGWEPRLQRRAEFQKGWVRAELFFPLLAAFIDKEIFTKVIEGERYKADIVVQTKASEEREIGVLIEPQNNPVPVFPRRMFNYDRPFTEAPCDYIVRRLRERLAREGSCARARGGACPGAGTRTVAGAAPNTQQLEDLCDTLLGFSSPSNLDRWLGQIPVS